MTLPAITPGAIRIETALSCLPSMRQSCRTGKVAVRKALTFALACIRDAVKPSQPHALSPRLAKRQLTASSPACMHCAARMAMEKMWKNSQKAIEEHKQKDQAQPYTTLRSGLTAIEELTKLQLLLPLHLSHASAAAQGPRNAMEDAHFFKEIPQGVIAGVLDGHGGDGVAEYASQAFQQRFADVLTQAEGNVYRAFNALIDTIQAEIVENDTFRYMGSTAVLCFIDKTSGLIYTATLGDSEANLYRRLDEGNWVSIPLSCVRDWASKRDAQRAAHALCIPELAALWPKISNPKCLRFPHPFFGLNVSRALGDIDYTGTREKPGVIHKAKITVNRLHPGDILILACDGLKDYVLESEILQLICHAPPAQNLAEILVDYALQIKYGRDNVTVVAIRQV